MVNLLDFAAYTTPKLVIIRDNTLTWTRLVLVVLIFIYVIVYEVVIRKGYLARDHPTGFIRLSFYNGKYLKADPDHCGNGVGPLGVKPFNKLPCKHPDRLESVIQRSSHEVFYTTRIKLETAIFKNSEDCVMNMAQCTATQKKQSKKLYYTRQPDTATMNIRHSVYGKGSGVTATWRRMRGVLQKYEGGKYTNWLDLTDPVGIAPITGCKSGKTAGERFGDCATLETWVKAAGVKSLDRTVIDINKDVCQTDCTAADHLDDENARYAGLVFLVLIEYSANSGTGDGAAIDYVMRVILLPGAEHKFEEYSFNENYSNLLNGYTEKRVIGRHGMGFIVMQSGYVGRFSLVELMKTLVTVNVLLAVAIFMVNKMLIKLMPFATLYREYIFTETIEFSNITINDEQGRFVFKDQEETPVTTDHVVYGKLPPSGKIKSKKWGTTIGGGGLGGAATEGLRREVDSGNSRRHRPHSDPKSPKSPNQNRLDQPLLDPIEAEMALMMSSEAQVEQILRDDPFLQDQINSAPPR